MIDFRYHLVSLVSVFLALAVGIVLGAGPLQGQITDQLTSRVNQLSDDKDNLQVQLNTTTTSVKRRDEFLTGLLPQLLADRLTGQSVVVVTVPGADEDAVGTLTTALKTAGATVTGRIDVQPAWTATDKAADRAAAVKALQGLLDRAESAAATSSPPSPQVSPTAATSTSTAAGTAAAAAASRSPSAKATARPSASATGPASAASGGGQPAAATSAAPSASPSATVEPTPQDQLLEALLARAVLTAQTNQAGVQDAVSQQILDRLTGTGLVSVNGRFTGRAEEAVLVVPGVEQATLAGAKQSPATSPSPDVSPLWSTLALSLDRAGDGSVVVGPASSATTGGVVAAVRATTEVSRRVSSVDTGGTPMGDVTTVYALREQLTGAAGAYGFGRGVSGLMPALATPGAAGSAS